MRNAIRFVTCAFSLLLSFGGLGGSASAQTKQAKKRSTDAVLVEDAPTEADYWHGLVFAHATATSGDSDVLYPRARIRLYRDPTPVGLLGEWDFRAKGNELKQLWLSWKTRLGTFKAGRLFLGAQLQTDAPFALKTYTWPKGPRYTPSSWGLQFKGPLNSFGDGWSMVADLSGNSGVPYDDPDTLGRLEGSAFLKKTGDSWSTSFALQASKDFVRGGVRVDLENGPWNAHVGVFGTDERSNPISGLLFVEHRLAKKFRPHVQVDAALGDVDVRGGFRIPFSEHVSVVADVDRHGDAYGRLQLMETF